eukprot:2945227-Prymnesium_polylepis.1
MCSRARSRRGPSSSRSEPLPTRAPAPLPSARAGHWPASRRCTRRSSATRTSAGSSRSRLHVTVVGRGGLLRRATGGEARQA